MSDLQNFYRVYFSTLPIGDGCDGVAFDPELKLAYSANGEGTLTVIKELNAHKFIVAENIKRLMVPAL